MNTFKEFIAEAKANFVEHKGVRVVPGSFSNNMIITYDEIDRTDGSGAWRKGTPLTYEVERYEEYGISIEYLKKSDFPLSFDIKTKESIKVRNLEEIEDDTSTYKQKGLPTNTVRIFFWNDNISFIIHKEDVDTFVNFETKDQSAIFKLVGY